MKKLLLDTHIWLWAVLEPARMSRRVSTELLSPDNELWLSAISVWEVLLLHRKGRLNLGQDPAAWVRKAVQAVPMNEVPVTWEVALVSQSLDLKHSDPADLFLAATAKVMDMTLVTADERLRHIEGISVLANR